MEKIDTKKKCILYKITFPNKKIYWGITTSSIKKRIYGHIYTAKKGTRYPVCAAIRKYGKENISVSVVLIGEKEFISDMEIAAIAHWKTSNSRYGYNVTRGGHGVSGENITAALRRSWANPEIRAKRIEIINSPEVKEKFILSSNNNKEANSKRMANLWSNAQWASDLLLRRSSPEIKEKQRLGIIESKKRPGYKEKMKEIMTPIFTSQSFRDQQRDGSIKAWKENPLKWITDGISNTKIPKNDTVPEGWRLGFIKRKKTVRRWRKRPISRKP